MSTTDDTPSGDGATESDLPQPPIPELGESPEGNLDRLRERVDLCRNCDLWRRATQAVFGEGPAGARLMFVGEQPGDQEDREGAPFVGPAGRVLDDALERAGIERDDVYITNVVKHFKWETTRGDRRLHKKPNMEEIRSCRPWLDAELAVVRPRVVVCMGATAAQSMLGRSVRVTKDRGEIFRPEFAPAATVTVHPSSVLRQRSDEERRQARAAFEGDIAAVRSALEER